VAPSSSPDRSPGTCRTANTRREFFYATPDEVKAHLLDVTGELLSFEEVPEALEYRQSQNLAKAETTQLESVAALGE
jgi:hypothetical protein